MAKLNPKDFSYATTNYNTSIWPLIILGEMLCFHFQKIIGFNLKTSVGEWKNRTNRWATPEKVYAELARVAYDKIKKDKFWVRKSLLQLEKLCHELVNFTATKIFKADLTRPNNNEIWQLYETYRRKYIQMYLYGWVPNAPEGHNDLFSEDLKKQLLVKLKARGLEDKLGEYFSVLTTLPKTTIREQEQIDFLKIMLKIKNTPSLISPLLRGRERRCLPLVMGRQSGRCLDQIKKLFSHHTRKYCWLPFDYEGSPWSVNYFIGEAKNLFNSGINPLKELRRLRNARKQLRLTQKKYWRQLELDQDPEFAYLLRTAQELMWWKNERKDYLYQSYYHVDKLVREISRRLVLSPTQVRHILPDEMKGALFNNHFSVKELNARVKHSVVILANHKTQIFTGKKAEILSKSFFPAKKKSATIKQLIGQTAYSGVAKGQVKIINQADDMVKMKRGDILVSEKTVPALLPAMKKAAAIVTDQGGITCHAAIMARELKIPCVIGTKIATQLFKDGDLIRVNADSGEVTMVQV